MCKLGFRTETVGAVSKYLMTYVYQCLHYLTYFLTHQLNILGLWKAVPHLRLVHFMSTFAKNAENQKSSQNGPDFDHFR